MPLPQRAAPWSFARRAFCATLGAGAALAAITAWVWPPAFGLPPLHARCLGAMQGALVLALLPAAMTPDAAPARTALAAAAAWGLALLPGGAAAAAIGLAVALPALALLRADRELQAPAQQADRAWLAVAALLIALALVLALAPAQAARLWPWPLPARVAPAYAAPLAAAAVIAAQLARERRAYVRRPALHALSAFGALVFGASAWHHASFDAGAPSSWCWFAAFAALPLLALRGARRTPSRR